MITASHNPPEYNGVKIVERDGTEMGDAEVIALEVKLFRDEYALSDWRGLGAERAAPELVEHYLDGILAHFPEGVGAGMTVAVDPGSGPAALTTPALLARMGCEVHTINGEPDGTFPGRMPEPTEAGLAPLADSSVRPEPRSASLTTAMRTARSSSTIAAGTSRRTASSP